MEDAGAPPGALSELHGGAKPAAAPQEQPAQDAAQQQAGTDHDGQPQQLYTLPGLEGQWTMDQLVDMEMQRDPRLGTVRRSALPPEFWDARRRARNHARLQRNYAKRKRKGDAAREEEERQRAGLSEAQQAEREAEREAAREAAKAAAAAQRERVAQAMQSGLRVVVDCSLSATASDREVRSLCKQLELCAAANKRAAAPVSLQFAGFDGAVKRFALEGMHADRWPAAAGHEAPLAQLFAGQELVVLSPDAEQPLDELHQDKVYVIGGLVDRTVRKGASLAVAQACGAAAARLPIAEHLGAGALAGGKGVLNVNDVFAVLLALHGGQGWVAALEAAIPQRLRQQPKQARQQAQQQQQQAQQQAQQQQPAEPPAGAAQAPLQQPQQEQQPAAGAAAASDPAPSVEERPTSASH